ncbi:MAG: SMP-30/gluconolactonase/LRE family protein [Actinomycetota bacterium]
MVEFTEVASGLRFPEGPIAMPDGSVVLVEMFGKCITRVAPDGGKSTVAKVEGGPNGIAVGPDGALYLCNNGGCFTEVDFMGLTFPGPFTPSNYIGGRIQRVDMGTGTVTDLYTECDGNKLRGPNDIVFDNSGGMWFTDHGIRHDRSSDLTGIYYAKTDGSMIREVVFPSEAPNGIGLSPDGTKLYWAETHTGRVFQATVTAPGEIAPISSIDPSACLCGLPGLQLLDSLAVDGDGNVCVATLLNGGITVISPSGEILQHIATGDPLTTNICFGGSDFQTAYITLSGTGKLVSMKWPYKGLRLNY